MLTQVLLLAGVLGVLASQFYKYILYPAFISPLSKVPNAYPLASICPAYIIWLRYKGRENRFLYAAHKRLGPIIRLGPKECSVNCVDGGLKTIYGKGWEKFTWHAVFENFGGVPNLFSSLPNASHAIRKRRIANIMSKSALWASPDFLEHARVILYDRLLPLVKSYAATSEPVDVLDLNYAIMMDFSTAYLLGLPNATNWLKSPEQRKKWLDEFYWRKPYLFWAQELPTLTDWLAKVGFHVMPPKVDEVSIGFEDWCMAMCDKADEAAKRFAELKPGEKPLVYHQLKSAAEVEKEKNPEAAALRDLHEPKLEVASEMLDQLFAAHETSGITLTYAMHELCLNPSYQKRLHDELKTLSPATAFSLSKPSLSTAKAVDNLPLLNAIIMETLRIHPALQGPLPRITPPGGGELVGYHIPEGVIVSANAYSLHRHEGVFPDPERWWPERWLVEEGEGEDRRDRWFWAFGSGARMCVGSHLAVLAMKHALAGIYRNFTTRIIDDTGIEQQDGFIVGPESNQLYLAFDRIEEDD